MYFSLDVLKARKGDCLMLHYGSKDDPHLMLIDGGPSNVYQPQLAPRLRLLRQLRGLDDTEPLPIDVVMVSHVDDDHIRGLLELTAQQRANSPPFRLAVGSLWHNSFDDLLTTRPDELAGGVTASLRDGGSDGSFDPGSMLAGIGKAALNGEVEVETEEEAQTVEVLASIPQGRELRLDAEALQWEPNAAFDGKLILVTGAGGAVTLDGGLAVTVAGPRQQEIEDLQRDHDDWVRGHLGGRSRTAEQALAAYVDASVANLSSIVVLAELGGRSILLTGDARGDRILQGMELAGLLHPGGGRHVDILKVPHHGSDNNMETGFFTRVTANHYVFSGDGEHGNPERATLQMLLDARGEDDDYVIHLTYPVAEIDDGREAEWIKQQAKEKTRKKTKPAAKVRADWSAAKQSLAALFAAHPTFAAKLTIVGDGKPHLINLLDKV